MKYMLCVLLFLTPGMQAVGQELTPREAKSQIEERGIDFTKSKFISAVIDGEAELVRLFLKAGIDPDTEFRREGVDMHVLEFAMSNRHFDVLETLLQNGANPNTTGVKVANLSTPIIHSAVDHPEALQMLITYGARNIEDSGGAKPVHKAVLSDTTANVRNRSLRILLRNGADPEAVVESAPMEGATPMLICAVKGRPEAARLLAQYGAEVSIEPSGWTLPEGKTIATVARETGNEETARVLEELMQE